MGWRGAVRRAGGWEGTGVVVGKAGGRGGQRGRVGYQGSGGRVTWCTVHCAGKGFTLCVRGGFDGGGCVRGWVRYLL